MISLAAVYVISYLTFNDSYDLFKIIRYKLQTNDQYKRVTRGACAGNMEVALEDELTASTTNGTYNTEEVNVAAGLFDDWIFQFSENSINT